ncbi:MAG: HEAT repeat domain-containing protein, partial [Pirellulaceae bacterium]|nr:HEAT repeat domain-containing protein [Pirellulaceae bacterium]
PETPKDAKRYICRWLAVVGSADCVPAVAELLSDADLSHPARMALEPLAQPAAAAALRDALAKVKGKQLLGVISSIGTRRDAQSVSVLRGLTGDTEATIAGAAITALGEIGTEEAARALDSLQVPTALTRTLARAKIAAANRLAAAGKTDAAAGVYQALLQPQQPEAIRVAALKGLLGTLPPAEAVRQFVDVIQGDDAALRTAALAAYVGSSNRALKDAVAAALPAMKPAGQLVLLGILSGEADVAARPVVLKVVEAGEVDVRVAALECLALHGEAADVALVVKLAQSEPASLAEAARRVLPRMGKPGVNEALVRLIESGQAGDRAVVLAALAARRVESALPTLARLAGDADTALATEAARALGVLGNNGQLGALAAVLIRTDNAELRGAAAEAVKSICSRAEDKPAAAKPLLAALSQARTPAARIVMLQQLVFTRGDEALNAVRRATQDADASVAEAAVRALIAWPEASAAPSLIELAKTTDKASFAVLALRDGCLRLANQKDLPLAQRLSIYRSVLETAKRAEEKRQAIAGLADLPALGALELLQAAARDAELKNDATTATIRLARQLGAVYNQQALAALEAIKAQSDSDDVKRQADEAIKAVRNAGQSPEGFVVAWLLSGPYTQQGKTGQDLFEVALAPEKSDDGAEWRPVTVPPGGKTGLVEMDKIFGGNDRVAYLKTQLASVKEQDAVLELGSDDGIKVWLNGQVVHANNATRPCAPGQDKVNVKLKQGPNTLLLKITQGGGEWSACCRVCAADGKPLDGVTVGPTGP